MPALDGKIVRYVWLYHSGFFFARGFCHSGVLSCGILAQWGSVTMGFCLDPGQQRSDRDGDTKKLLMMH